MKDDSVKSKTIEWLRFFCIAAVVLLHAKGWAMEGHDTVACQNGVYDTIRILFAEGLCRVAVPILFIISGYLFFVKLEEWNTGIWADKLKRRVRTLLIPYLLWNLISICVALGKEYLKFFARGGEAPDIAAWFASIGGLRSFWSWGIDGYPHNIPLWYIRNLIVFVIFAPVVYVYVKRTGIVGLCIMYILYVSEIMLKWSGVFDGLFSFSLGACFAIHRLDFTDFFKKFRIVAACASVPILVMMVLTSGNNEQAWGYAHRLFTLFGSAATIGVVSLLFQQQRLKVRPLLSKSSFFVYAAHGTIVLPVMYSALGRVLPENQAGQTIRFFATALLTIALLVVCYYYLNKWMPGTMAVLTGGRAKQK